MTSGGVPPSGTITVRGEAPLQLGAPRLLDSCLGWHFWRFEVAVALSSEERAVDYEVTTSGVTKRATFWVQEEGKPFHVGYTSCNGISGSIPADHYSRVDPTCCWRDLMQVHASSPIHVLIGGGDQVYSDAIWKQPLFTAWGDLHKHEKLRAAWTEAHEAEATAFYLRNYLASYTMPVVSDAYASIASYMIWDDHDIWDGYGSYSKGLQASEFFAGLFAVARRFYLLFQLQTTETLASANEQLEWIDKDKADGFHSVKFLGPQIAGIGIDMRSKRTKKRILPESTYHVIEEQMLGLPASVEHVLVLSGVPVVFPSIPTSESILFGMLALFKRSAVLRRLGRRLGVLDQFDQPEILDDLLDGWASSKHKHEKNEFVKMLQRCALEKKYRVTILSGDAHVGGVGEIYGAQRPRLKKEEDALFMYQIISSAVMNSPPPPGVVAALTRTNFSQRIDHNTRSKMQRAFVSLDSSKATSRKPPKKLLDQRNWCDIRMVGGGEDRGNRGNGNDDGGDGRGLCFSLRSARPGGSTCEDVYDFVAPPFPTNM